MLLEQLRLARVDDENTIENITFEGEVLEELDLSSIDFEKVTFKKCRLIQCDFTKVGSMMWYLRIATSQMLSL